MPIAQAVQIRHTETRDAFGLPLEGAGEPITARVARSVIEELHLMRQVMGDFADTGAFASLERGTLSALGRIAAVIRRGGAMPWNPLRLSPGAPHVGPFVRRLRIGVFPTAANPLHWMHLLSGLEVMARFHLDKIIYVIAGTDPRKQFLAPEGVRHRMAVEVLKIFHPLFAYSPIACGDSRPGEEWFFELLALNPRQPIDAYYIAGGDHFHRLQPRTGSPDTIERLERGILERADGLDIRMQKLSVVFLERGEPKEDVMTFLDVHWVSRLPFRASSTSIREAIEGRCPMDTLALLPFTALDFIRADNLYCPSRTLRGRNGSASMHAPAGCSHRREECVRFLKSLRRRFALTA